MRLTVHAAKRPIETRHPAVLVTGDGRTLIDDLDRFKAWGIPHDVYAIGRSINLHDDVLHWGNVDGPTSEWWAEHLPAKNRGEVPLRHTLGDVRGYDIDWDIVDEHPWDPESVLWHGSTALFAAMGCIEMGYAKIILAGCPMDSRGHWYHLPHQEPYGPRWPGEAYQAWLEFAKAEKSRLVRSMSGYTAQMIGEATQSWANA